MKTLVVIPCKNLENEVGGVIAGIRAIDPELDVLVVDDGSTDHTSRAASDAGAEVLAHAENMGKGAALKTGFGHAVERGYDAVITMDGDGQHDPATIPVFTERFARGDADILVGSRMHAVGDMPALRVWTNRTTSRIVSGIAGQDIPDSQSGYRMIGTAVLRDIAGSLVTTRYDMESELLIRAGRRGYRIAAVPIESIYEGSVSHINPLVDTCRFVGLVFRSLFWR